MSGTPVAADLDARRAEFWERTPYESAFDGSFGRYMTEVETRALERVCRGWRPDVALDLGCGHGRFLAWLAARAGLVAGLDRSRRLLDVAARDAASAVGSPPRLMRASATAIPLASASVDGITCVRVIQHISEQDTVLREAARVVRPGGALVLVQYNAFSPHGLARAVKRPIKAVLRAAWRWAGRTPPFDEPTEWTHARALRRQLARCGWQVERMTGAWLFPLQYFSSRRTRRAWRPALAFAFAVERLADRAPFRHLGGYLVVRCRRAD